MAGNKNKVVPRTVLYTARPYTIMYIRQRFFDGYMAKKHTFAPVQQNVSFPEIERKLLSSWYENGVVEKYLHRNDASHKKFFFLDGPITANNPMGVHHAWGRTYKDLWQRFFALRGYKERFQNGFDCQGLWVEVEVEKELGIKNKRDIENLVPGDKKASIAKFVDLCRERVMKFSGIQTEQSKRLGYIVNWDHSYFTMSDENNYMIWYFLKVCFEKGWIYKGKDSVPWCPRCQTAISQHEMLTEDYKELTHETLFVKMAITTPGWENTFLLVWTTTPWTVPANVAVGVNVKFTYKLWKNSKTNEQIIILYKNETAAEPTRQLKNKELSVADYIFTENREDWVSVKEVSGKELVGLSYTAPFDVLPRVEEARKENPKTFHTVVDGSAIVVSTEGTGLLHVAPGAGKEDFDLGKKEHLPVISVIDDEANYLGDMNEFSGKNAKKHPELIVDYLKSLDGGKYLLKSMMFTHRYPACWRCKTELVWKVADEWYISMDVKENGTGDTLREQMKKTAKQITWKPAFGLERELDWLENMHDWLISKPNRYWGLALPIYECAKCGFFTVIGSKDELQAKAVSGWSEFEGHTPHKPYIDEVKIKCEKCGETVSRLNDVGNVWLDAGIVGFSTLIDPVTKKLSYTTDKKYWEEWFPADFITESFPGQFKNWFYSMIAMSTVLEKTSCFKTVLGYASMLAEDGRPMHKSWGNSIEFNEAADKIGADVMRWMFVTHDPEQNLLFGYKKADETRRKFHLLLWNIYNFFVTYAVVDGWEKSTDPHASKNILDVWILSRLNNVIQTVTVSLEKFDPFTASTAIENFVNDLSTWYLRRSRDRVGPSVDAGEDKDYCYAVLWEVLVSLCQLLAPFTPFLSEEIYKNLTGEESVHLSDWPTVGAVDAQLEKDMVLARQVVEKAHAVRKEHSVKVRVPLATLTYKADRPLSPDIEQVIAGETNVKKLVYAGASSDVEAALDLVLTDALKAEGEARETIRAIQMLRKEKGCTINGRISIELPQTLKHLEKDLIAYIQKETLADGVTWGEQLTISTG